MGNLFKYTLEKSLNSLEVVKNMTNGKMLANLVSPTVSGPDVGFLKGERNLLGAAGMTKEGKIDGIETNAPISDMKLPQI